MNQSLSGSYQLTQDINCTGKTFYVIESVLPFTGTLEGNGHKIINLTISAVSGNMGMFSNASGATIQNIIFENFSVHGTAYSNYTGLLAAQATNSKVTNVTLTSSGATNSVTGYGKSFRILKNLHFCS